jgi:hypothetical protein
VALAALGSCAADEARNPVPPQYAGFAGRWTGLWDGIEAASTVLTVTNITPQGEISGSYRFMSAEPVRFRTPIENGAFSFGANPRFTFTLRSDGQMAGERVTPTVTNRTVLSRQ